MSETFLAACIQTNSGPEPGPNLSAAADLIRAAAAAGAELVLTPETTDMIAEGRQAALALAEPEETHPGLPLFAGLARNLGIWLSIGSLVIKLGPETLANRSFLFAPDGTIKARYDKIHMFDVEIPDGQSYRESRTYQAGNESILTDLPWGRLGLTICYDLRFPGLYRDLAQAGADFLTAPSAFTRFTGSAHWHVLLRARAIETGCFVFAAAQCGEHARGRKTYGHALIVSPWGEVLAEAGRRGGLHHR